MPTENQDFGAIPKGGTTGQIIRKKDNDDFQLEWIDASGGTAGGGVPSGGAAGQFLVKDTAADFDSSWQDNPLPAGGTENQVLRKSSDTDYDTEWADDIGETDFPSGGTAGQMIRKTSGTNYETEWIDIPVPVGGTAGQHLAKINNNNYSTEWTDPPNGIPDGGTSGQILIKDSTVDGAASWTDARQSHDLPTGGTSGQLLQKSSATDFDAAWTDKDLELPNGGTTGQALVKTTNTDYDVEWTTVRAITESEADKLANLTDSPLISQVSLRHETNNDYLTQFTNTSELEGTFLLEFNASKPADWTALNVVFTRGSQSIQADDSELNLVDGESSVKIVLDPTDISTLDSQTGDISISISALDSIGTQLVELHGGFLRHVMNATGQISPFIGLDEYTLPMVGMAPDKNPIDSGIQRLDSGTGMYEADAGFIFPRDSIQIGHAGILSGFGALIKGRSYVTNRLFILPFQYYDTTNGSERTRELSFPAPTSVDIQGVSTQNVPNSGMFQYTPTNNVIAFDFTFRCPPNGILEQFRVRATVNGNSEPFYYFPNRAAWENNTGVDIDGGLNGEHLVDLTDSPMVIPSGTTIDIEYVASSGTLLGDTNDAPYVKTTSSVFEFKELARVEDLPTPRTDSEIQTVVDSTVLVGNGLTKTDNGDGTFTLSVGGAPPVTEIDRLFYGLSSSNNPTTIDPTSLTSFDNPTNPYTISTGTTSQGDYFIILVPADEDISTIFDTVLQQDVTSIFTKTTDAQTINIDGTMVSYNSYVIGELNAGINETYVLNF